MYRQQYWNKQKKYQGGKQQQQKTNLYMKFKLATFIKTNYIYKGPAR